MKIVYTQPSGQEVTIEVDATIKEGHATTAIVTEHPVEQGANVADHMRPELEKLTLEVLVTNTPIVLPGSHMHGVRLEDKPLDLNRALPGDSRYILQHDGMATLSDPGAPNRSLLFGITMPGRAPKWTEAALVKKSVDLGSMTTRQFSDVFDRVRALYDEFRMLIYTRTLCRVVTSIRDYENMLLRSLNAPRDVESGDAITFTLEATQVRFAKSETVRVIPKQVRAQPKKNEGTQPATPPPPAPAVRESALRHGTKAGAQMVGEWFQKITS